MIAVATKDVVATLFELSPAVWVVAVVPLEIVPLNWPLNVVATMPPVVLNITRLVKAEDPDPRSSK